MQRPCNLGPRNQNRLDPLALQALCEGKHQGSLVLTVSE
jgi:hypothetical protein